LTFSMLSAATKPSSAAGRDYRFGPFLLMPAQRCLLNGVDEVRLNKRAFDLLVMLVQRAGSVISHDELIAQVWSSTVVEEVNLRVHISSLRSVLREGGEQQRYIDNIPGQGYCFVAPVVVYDEQALELELSPAPLLGRDADIARLATDVPQRRFISIVGTGGIGKTALARAVGAQLAAQASYRLCRIDLGALADGTTALGALARSVGVPQIADADVVSALARGQANRPLLVVLDSCEYRLQEAAALADALLEVPRLSLLTTSREPLLAHGETIFRPAPLALPAIRPGMGAAEVLAAPAVALFVQSALAHDRRFVLRDENAAALASLCQQLDGLPLAIALSAELIASFGVDELLAKRHDRFCTLVADAALRPPRHRTLWASLEWSYQRMSLQEQIVLRRLSVFRRNFSFADAMLAIRCARLSTAAILDILMALVAKSLISVVPGLQGTQYRLLNTTRTYAFEKLCAAGEQGGRAVDDGPSSRIGLLTSDMRIAGHELVFAP